MPEDYYSALARTLAAVGQDHAHLRMMIYKFARNELRNDLFRRKGIRWTEIQEQTAALERAIDRIEADIASDPEVLGIAWQNANGGEAASNTALVVHGSSSISARESEILPPRVQLWQPVEQGRQLVAASPAEAAPERPPPTKPIRNAFWSTVQLVVAVVLGVALFSALQDRDDLRRLMTRYIDDHRVNGRPIADEPPQKQMETAAVPGGATLGEKAPAVPPRLNLGPQIGSIAMPSSYGVYAISHGKLVDLQMLSIKVPDQRVSVSAVISTPPGATLPDGHVEFVAFRRDLAANAPEQATVRIVARVKRALTFDTAGKPRMTDVEGAWAVRGNSYPMKVGPVNGNAEMILIRPEDEKLLFPAGRYALMLKGLAYDFSVDGPVTDVVHCLERTDALNAPVYSECRTP
jgi:hypothetical protein